MMGLFKTIFTFVVSFFSVPHDGGDFIFNGTPVRVVRGDILDQHAQVVVDPANMQLSPGGGLSLFLFKKAGSPSNWATARPKNFSTGDAFLNPGVEIRYKGNAMHVVHTVGPCCAPGTKTMSPIERKQLKHAYVNALEAAEMVASPAEKIHIALPLVSVGIFNCPVEEVADIAANVIIEHTQRPVNRTGEVTIAILDANKQIETKNYNAMVGAFKRKMSSH